MHCQFCGSEAQPGVSTCPNCGGAIEAAPPMGAPVVTSGINPAGQQPTQASPGKPKKSLLFRIICIVVLLCVICGIGNCVLITSLRAGNDNARIARENEQAARYASEIAMPDVVGMSPNSANIALSTISGGGSDKWKVVFTIDGQPTADSAHELGEQGYVVIGQNPAPGEKHMGSETLKITLDLTKSSNKSSSASASSNEQQQEQGTEQKPASASSEQTEPAPSAEPHQAMIFVMPDLAGMNAAEANTILKGYGMTSLNIAWTSVDSDAHFILDKSNWMVVSTIPAAGAQVDPNRTDLDVVEVFCVKIKS